MCDGDFGHGRAWPVPGSDVSAQEDDTPRREGLEHVALLRHDAPMSDLLAIEQELRERLLAFPRPMRGAFLSVLRMPSWERADVIEKIYGSGRLREFSELLMDLEDDRYARTVVLGLLAELERDQ